MRRIKLIEIGDEAFDDESAKEHVGKIFFAVRHFILSEGLTHPHSGCHNGCFATAGLQAHSLTRLILPIGNSSPGNEYVSRA